MIIDIKHLGATGLHPLLNILNTLILCVQVSRIGLCVQVSRIGLCVQVSRIGLCGILNLVHSSVSSYYVRGLTPHLCIYYTTGK